MPTGSHGFTKYPFKENTGYIIAPWLPDSHHPVVALRHSAGVPAWSDRDIHLHRDSEEYFFVIQGELLLLVAGSMFTLQPGEVLAVQPGVPHAVAGGYGPVEHFVLRVPAPDDRQSTGELPSMLPHPEDGTSRLLKSGWGARIPLTDAQFHNCWLFGVGQARFHSDQMCLAYLSFPNELSAQAVYQRHPNRLHLHQDSWEIYTVLQGQKVLQVGEESIEINAGETLVVEPGTRHLVKAVHTPFEGFTFRTPLLDDKVEC